MKQLLLSIAFASAAIAASAQGATAIFFTEFGEKFTLYINGAQQNDTPAANVRVDGLTQEYFQVRVDFEDDMNADFAANGGAERGMESTIMIKKNRKGNYVLRMNGVAPLGTTEVEAEPVAISVPVEEPSPSTTTTTVKETTTVKPGSSSETITTTTTIKDTGDEVGISMKVGDEEVGISIQVPGMDGMETETTVTETTMTTTSTSTTSTNTVEEAHMTRPAPTSGGPCAYPMGDQELDQLKASIEDKTFEDSKLTLAKQATKSKCMTAQHVKEIMMIFTFEDTKLEYAKFAYDYTFDQENYYIVNDAFEFEMTMEELNEFLESR